MKKWINNLVRRLRYFFSRPEEETTVEPTVKFYVVPMVREKWVNPSSKNDKHYRAIFRSNTGLRRISKTKFKRAFDVQVYGARFDLRLCGRRENAIRGQGSQGA